MPQNFSDKDIMTDLLTSQKHATDGYNTFANECATPKVRNDFIQILTDEHKIQSEVFDEMGKRGWYPTESADQSKINQAKQMFTDASSAF